MCVCVCVCVCVSTVSHFLTILEQGINSHTYTHIYL